MLRLLAGSLVFCFVFAQNLYPIAEPDLLGEIQSKKEVLLKRLEKEVERTGKRVQEPEFWATSLPLSDRSRVYYVDMLYTLEFDIPRVDERGRVIGVLYPRGYRFNPLYYVPADPPTLIIFDGKDQRQLRYVKERLLPANPYRLLIVGRGDYFKLIQYFGERVYFLHPRIKERLNITQGISVVKWNRKEGKARVEVHGCDKVDCGTFSSRGR